MAVPVKASIRPFADGGYLLMVFEAPHKILASDSIKNFHWFYPLMSPKDQSSVESPRLPLTPSPRVPLASSSRVSWSLLLLLLTIPLLFVLHILVLRYSCLAPAWTSVESDSLDELKAAAAIESESLDELKAAAALDAIEPLAEPRGSMDDSEADLGGMDEADQLRRGSEAEAPRGMQETEAPREMQETEAPRGMEEVEPPRGVDEAEPPRGIIDAGRSADRLRYPGRKRVVGFVGMFTDFSRRERRALLRDTWFPGTPDEHARVEAATGLVFRFIIGNGWSDGDEQMLQAENSTHGDLLRIDVDEANSHSNRKALVFFTSLFKLYEADFYVKADDSVYLIPDHLSSLIARPRESPRTYLGCFKNGVVISNPDMSEFEQNARLLGPQYFLHAYSNIYALSYGVVKILNAVPNGRLRMFVSEDVTMGAWMLAFNVTHERSWPLCQNICTPSAVAVWDMPVCSGLCKPEVQMKQLHENPSCSGKEPVQPL